MTRITTEMLVEFDRRFGDNQGFSYRRTKDNGRPVYVMSNTQVTRSHHALAYLYGRLAETYRAGDKPLLSVEWVRVTKEAKDRDVEAWYRYENLGRESVPINR